MSQTAIQRALGLGPVFDRWLRFAPALQARYDAERGRARADELRSAILIGVVFYNVYNITSLVLMRDIAWQTIALRVGLFTPVTLTLYWLVGRLPPRRVEQLVLGGMINSLGLSLFQFWLTRDPLGLYTFGELSLCVVFGNMLLALRFPHAVVYTLFTMAATGLVIWVKPNIEPAIRFAFAVQMLTACAFALSANYRLERRRCKDYVAALEAVLEAECADAARRTFQDLSRTDALTGLPNRRHLSDKLDEWWPDPWAIGLMMVDIDHFKSYNDVLGHPAGDECLRQVAAVLAATAERTGGFCARFGGEEFTLLLRDTDEVSAARAARALVEAVRAAAIPHPARSDGVRVVTVSVGVALRQDGTGGRLSQLFTDADRALYAAKDRGRNGFAFEDPDAFQKVG